MILGPEFLLLLLLTEQLLYVVGVQLIFPINLIRCPYVVPSYHTVFREGLPVEIAYLGAPVFPLGEETWAMKGWRWRWRWWRRWWYRGWRGRIFYLHCLVY